MDVVWAAINCGDTDFKLLRPLDKVSYRQLPRKRLAEYVTPVSRRELQVQVCFTYSVRTMP